MTTLIITENGTYQTRSGLTAVVKLKNPRGWTGEIVGMLNKAFWNDWGQNDITPKYDLMRAKTGNP